MTYTVSNKLGFGALLWQVHRSEPPAPVEAFTFTQDQAKRIALALSILDDATGQHQWTTDEDQPQCVRCGKTYRRDIPPCQGHH